MNIAAPRILAIDDASENLESLETAVKHVFPDAAFFAAQSASKGLELALSRDPDVILLDVVMPEMDGFEVCRRIKEDARLRNIPVAMITAIQPDKAICEKAFDSGAEAFITKPLELWDLAVQIRAMLKLKTANISQQAEQGRLQEMVARRTRELAEELASRDLPLGDHVPLQHRNTVDSLHHPRDSRRVMVARQPEIRDSQGEIARKIPDLEDRAQIR